MTFSNFILLGSKAPTSWKYYTAYTSSGSFYVFQSGYYRIYCIGRCGDGGESNYQYAGAGGGGSGGISISNLNLSYGDTVSISIASGNCSFGPYLSATGGGDGSPWGPGGAGGNASGGNVANYTGFSGGDGGPQGSQDGRSGSIGGNGGMIGGIGGSSQATSQPGGSGGGGGARLPGEEECKYISPVYTTLYRAAGGGPQRPGTAANAQSYPSISYGDDMVLFGGGGGGGGHGYFGSGGEPSAGTPAMIIIEIPQ